MTTVRTRARLGVPVVIVTVLAGLAFLVGTASAANFPVTTNVDSGPGSIRRALNDAATNPGPDTVTVQPGLGTITLNSGELAWNGLGAVTIIGNGVTIDAAGAPRALNDDGGSGITFSNLTITGVGGTTPDDAAPVVSQGGIINASDCVLTGNNVTSTGGDVAGGILSEGLDVSVDNCIITNNTATTTNGDAAGGVLSEGGALVVTNSTISGNTASTEDGNSGGGLQSEGGNMSVADTEITCNSATASDDAGGGILNEGGTLGIFDSTINGNTATSTGGGEVDNAVLSPGNDPTVENSTIDDDTSICDVPEEPPAATPAAVTPAFTG